jgi:hypothetical protein
MMIQNEKEKRSKNEIQFWESNGQSLILTVSILYNASPDRGLINFKVGNYTTNNVLTHLGVVL